MRQMKNSGIEWIGQIPQEWIASRLKFYTEIDSGEMISKDEFDENGEFSVIGSNGEIGRTNKCNNRKAVITTGRVGTVGTIQVVDEAWITDNALIIDSKMDIGFLKYVIPNFDFDAMLSGTAQPLITSGKLKNQYIPLPSRREQSRIAYYLDAKCAEIDELIAAKEKTNALLKERRQSIIYEAVTKGLNPDAPMKDSGVEWIGQIPTHWEFSKLKYDAYMKGRIGWQGLKADEFIEEGPYLVTGTDFEDGKIQWERSYHISDERFAEAPEIHLKEQDLLITKDGTIGKLAYIDYLPGPASLNSHLLVIRPKNKRFINKYLYWVLSSDVFLQYTEYAQDGTIMASLSQEKISRFVFGLPSIAEQQSIVDYLDNQCEEMDTLILANKSTIQKLKEYRQSIIYEAVTGKIEI